MIANKNIDGRGSAVLGKLRHMEWRRKRMRKKVGLSGSDEWGSSHLCSLEGRVRH